MRPSTDNTWTSKQAVKLLFLFLFIALATKLAVLAVFGLRDEQAEKWLNAGMNFLAALLALYCRHRYRRDRLREPLPLAPIVALFVLSGIRYVPGVVRAGAWGSIFLDIFVPLIAAIVIWFVVANWRISARRRREFFR